MSEKVRGGDAVLARALKLLLPAGLCLAFSFDEAMAWRCGRGQILVVGRHTCVSRQTFQEYLRSWRTGRALPVAAPRSVERPRPRPGAVEAELPVPPPKPAVIAARPAPAPAERAPVPISPAKPAAAAGAPVKPAESAAAPPPAETAAIPAPAISPSHPAAAKPASPFGELQVH